MILDKNSLTAFVKPFKASSASNTLVVTLPKFFTDMLGINNKTDLMVRVNKDNKELTITKIDSMNIMEMMQTCEVDKADDDSKV